MKFSSKFAVLCAFDMLSTLFCSCTRRACIRTSGTTCFLRFRAGGLRCVAGTAESLYKRDSRRPSCGGDAAQWFRRGSSTERMRFRLENEFGRAFFQERRRGNGHDRLGPRSGASRKVFLSTAGAGCFRGKQLRPRYAARCRIAAALRDGRARAMMGSGLARCVASQ